ncbi:hypothetical protein ATANTOWER_014832, partial [Ataeniobius toweri]|nr:hypothetical protein [Ataeniobius toweri]
SDEGGIWDWNLSAAWKGNRRSPEVPLAGGWRGFAGKAESMESNGYQQSLTGNLGKEGKVREMNVSNLH